MPHGNCSYVHSVNAMIEFVSIKMRIFNLTTVGFSVDTVYLCYECFSLKLY